MVEALLEAGVDCSTTDAKNITPITKATVRCQWDVVRLLLKSGADQKFLNGGFSFLHVAAVSGDIPRIDSMLDAGLDINLPSDDGTTALHWAALRHIPDAVQKLLSRGANLEAAMNNGASPLHLEAIRGSLKVMELIMLTPMPGPTMDAHRCTAQSNGISRMQYHFS